MRRVLVINSVGLWISLNRHFAGRESVRVTEASSLDMGVQLARVERPALIVCQPEEFDCSVNELAATLIEAKLDAIPTLCVDSRASGATAADSPHPEFTLCGPNQVVEGVDAALKHTASLGSTSYLEILAHYESRSGFADQAHRGFVNLLEIGSRRILLESNIPVEVGEVLDLAFFLPREGGESESGERIHVTLECEIRRCTNPTSLTYAARIKSIDDTSEVAFHQYVKSRLSGGESLA